MKVTSICLRASRIIPPRTQKRRRRLRGELGAGESWQLDQREIHPFRSLEERCAFKFFFNRNDEAFFVICVLGDLKLPLLNVPILETLEMQSRRGQEQHNVYKYCRSIQRKATRNLRMESLVLKRFCSSLFGSGEFVFEASLGFERQNPNTIRADRRFHSPSCLVKIITSTKRCGISQAGVQNSQSRLPAVTHRHTRTHAHTH